MPPGHAQAVAHDRWAVQIPVPFCPARKAGLAAHARMSPHTFLRRFTDETGSTPLQWILRARVDTARELLESTRPGIACRSGRLRVRPRGPAAGASRPCRPRRIRLDPESVAAASRRARAAPGAGGPRVGRAEAGETADAASDPVPPRPLFGPAPRDALLAGHRDRRSPRHRHPAVGPALGAARASVAVDQVVVEVRPPRWRARKASRVR